MAALGPTQVLVLCALDEREQNGLDLPTAVTVGEHIAQAMVDAGLRMYDCKIPETDAALGALRRCERRGLVERLDRSDGARCWGLTDAGREALRQMNEAVTP